MEISDALRALVVQSELIEVLLFELSAKRIEDFEGSKVSERIEVTPIYNLITASTDDQMGFQLRITTKLTLDVGEISCDIASRYKLKEKIQEELDNELLVEYANEVALMTLIPFIRQHIADISQRVLGFPLLMPVMQRGQIKFAPNKEIAQETN